MDIDFIKWMCDKADGFEIEQDCVSACPLKMPGGTRTSIDLRSDYVRLERYPLLLQRAIEGVNRKYEKDENNYCIDLMSDDLEVGFNCYTRQHNFIKDFDSVDQAKESALKYVKEQEENK